MKKILMLIMTVLTLSVLVTASPPTNTGKQVIKAGVENLAVEKSFINCNSMKASLQWRASSPSDEVATINVFKAAGNFAAIDGYMLSGEIHDPGDIFNTNNTANTDNTDANSTYIQLPGGTFMPDWKVANNSNTQQKNITAKDNMPAFIDAG